MTRLWLAAGAVIVLAGAVLTYLLTSGPEQPDAAPPPPKPAPTLKPLAYGSEAIWSTPDGVGDVDVRDGVAVYEHDGQLVVVDAATGLPRWRVDEFTPLPGDTGLRWLSPFSDLGSRLVEHDSGLAVLTAYDGGDAADEQGLVLLSAADGGVLWHTPLRKPMSAEVFELRAVNDRVAVTTNRTGDTAAVAIRSGKRLWTRPATDAKAIAGDVVLVQGTDPSPSPSGKLLSQVTALDLSTGAVSWDLTDRYDGSEVLAGGEDTAQVRAGTGGKEVGKLLATGDGHELADVDGEGGCATGDGLLACPGVDGVVVRDLATGAVTETGVSASGVDRIQDGRFHLRAGDRVWTIDAVGNVLDEKLPGELTAVTDDVVCFRLSSSYSVACHALA